MLTLHIPGIEQWNESAQEFVYTKSITLELEHSLVSLSKWESVWEKPWLGTEKKTTEEALSYIVHMSKDPNITLDMLKGLTDEHVTQVNDYLNAKMSATWFTEAAGKGSSPGRKEIITSEILYYWMFTAQIPLECEHWHLNRLFTLLKVFNEKNAPPKKMNTRDAAAQRRLINEQRKAKLQTTG